MLHRVETNLNVGVVVVIINFITLTLSCILLFFL